MGESEGGDKAGLLVQTTKALGDSDDLVFFLRVLLVAT